MSNFYLTNSSSSHSLNITSVAAPNVNHNKLAKKPQNPNKTFDLSQIVDEPIDSYLESLGLWKKRIARDGSCLFRSVAEQIRPSQMCHEEVRQECVKFMEENRKDYEQFVNMPFDEYLSAMKNPLEYGSQLEILAMSKLYKRDFIIYHEPEQPGLNVTQNGFDENIILCYSYNNHYDAVFTKKYRDDLALIQSLVYEILYEKVFASGDQVSVARRLLRKSDTIYPKEFMDIKNTSQDSFENEEDSININDVDFENLSIKYNENEDKPSSDTNDSAIDINNNNMNGSKLNGQQVKMPLPYKVAKSLDPVIYRNTAFDAWIANKKESEECLNQKLIMQLKQGDKCFVRINNYFGTNWILAYMQSINTNNTAYVFIPDLNDRQLVTFENIKVYTTDNYISTNNIKNVQKCVQPVNAQFQKLIQNIENKRRNIKKKQFTLKKSASFHVFSHELPPLIEVNEDLQLEDPFVLQFNNYHPNNFHYTDYQASLAQMPPQMVHSQSSYANFSSEKVPLVNHNIFQQQPQQHQQQQQQQQHHYHQSKSYQYKSTNSHHKNTNKTYNHKNNYNQQHQPPLLPTNPKITLPNIAPYGTQTWHNIQSSPATTAFTPTTYYTQTYPTGQNPTFLPPPPPPPMVPYQTAPPYQLYQQTPSLIPDPYYQHYTQQNRKRHESFDSYLHKVQSNPANTTATSSQQNTNQKPPQNDQTSNYLLMPAPTTTITNTSNTATNVTSGTSGIQRSHSYHAGISNTFNYDNHHTQTPVYIDMYIPHAPPHQMYQPPPQIVLPQPNTSSTSGTNQAPIYTSQNSIENQINYDTNALLDDTTSSNGWNNNKNTNKLSSSNGLFHDMVTYNEQQQQTSSTSGQTTQYTIYNNLTNCYVVNIEGPINYNATHSIKDDGSDLLSHDISTIRYFYNLGIEYYRLNIANSNQNPSNYIYQKLNDKTNDDTNRKLQ